MLSTDMDDSKFFGGEAFPALHQHDLIRGWQMRRHYNIQNFVDVVRTVEELKEKKQGKILQL